MKIIDKLFFRFGYIPKRAFTRNSNESFPPIVVVDEDSKDLIEAFGIDKERNIELQQELHRCLSVCDGCASAALVMAAKKCNHINEYALMLLCMGSMSEQNKSPLSRLFAQIFNK